MTTTQILDTAGGTLAFEVTGDAHPITAEKPLMVLAHGMGDDRRAFRFLAPALVRAGHRVVAVDLRGCGDSSAEWDSFTRTAIAGDLVAVTEHLLAGEGPEARAVLVGHSIAGGAATIAAASAPHLYSCVVEVGPFTRKQSVTLASLRDRDFRRGMRHLVAATMLGSGKAWARYLDVAYPETPGVASRPVDHAERVAQIQDMLAEPGRMKALQKMGASAPTDAGKQLARLTRPMLVIQGADDPDWADPQAEGELILADLPAGPVRELSRLVMVPGSGHYPHVQHPGEVFALITGFLDELPPVSETSPTAGRSRAEDA